VHLITELWALLSDNSVRGCCFSLLHIQADTVHLAAARSQVPAIGRLPNSARSLLTVGPPVLWYLYSNVASARNNKKTRLHAEHSPETGSAVFTQGADMTQQRKDLKLSLPQRSAMWAVDNPLLAIGTIGAPLAGYGLYLNTQYPGMTFTQKVMKSSVAGQVCYIY
jgi:hypothetical protein